MTEHSKIPLPPKGEGSEPEDQPSLLERATSSFGLDGFRPAPVPNDLAGARMKRARPVYGREQAVTGSDLPLSGPSTGALPAETIETETLSPVPTPDSALPVTVAPSVTTVDQSPELVSLAGEPHKIERAKLREAGMIVPGEGASSLLEEFRIVKRQLIGAARQAGTARSRRVLVCSPHSGEGKTFCAINLALAMANERDGEVLLVDADFANPSIPAALGLPKGPGLMDILADPECDLRDCIMATDIPGLFVLPAGKRTDIDSEYLASADTGDLLDRLTLGAPQRMVVFDTPPALAASPVADLAKHVGQTLLIARAEQTGQSALEDAARLLSACPDIKLLLNAALFSPSGRRFGSYYGYEG